MYSSSTPWDPAFERLVLSHLLSIPRHSTLAPELNLRLSGLDSCTILGLLADIEKIYEVKIPARLLTYETFETPAMLWAAIREAKAII